MTRTAKVYVNDMEAGFLIEFIFGKKYRFEYLEGYSGPPVSLTMPVSQRVFDYDMLPPFFDGILPEGFQLDGLLKYRKLDRNDLFSQLIAVGEDLIGNVTVKEVTP
jgi:serine/threonine-protein kinase HipA